MSARGTQPQIQVNAAANVTRRVHTPGKYIIVFGILPLCIVASVISGAILGGRGYKTPFAIEFRDNAQGQKTAYYTLPEILVDLAPDQNGRISYLKTQLAVALDMSTQEENRLLDELRPLLSERVTLFFRALRPDDFQGTENMMRIKKALVHRINLTVGQELADDVILQNLIIQ